MWFVQDDWKNKFSLISEVPGVKKHAFCKLCQSKIFLSNMGLTASERDIKIFRNECRNFLLKTATKMQDRSPLQYSLTKAISCFDPAVVLVEKTFSMRLTQLLLILSQKNWISGVAADALKRQFKEICTRPHVKQALQKFKRSERIDKFWFKIFVEEGASCELLKILKMVMSLSNGNANVERGFSINSDCLWENMKEESLISRRRVYDTIASKGGIDQVSISKEMLKYARNARARYAEAADIRRKEQHEKVASMKRKREAAIHMKSLEAKKMKILQEAEKQKSAIEEEIAALRLL